MKPRVCIRSDFRTTYASIKLSIKFFFFCLPAQADKVDSREAFHISVCTLKPRFAHKDEFSRKCETSGRIETAECHRGGGSRTPGKVNNKQQQQFSLFPPPSFCSTSSPPLLLPLAEALQRSQVTWDAALVLTVYKT